MCNSLKPIYVMKRNLLARVFPLLLCALTSTSLIAQEFTGAQANKKLPGTEFVKYGERSEVPEFARFRKGSEVPLPMFSEYINRRFGSPEGSSLKLTSVESDDLGYKHYRYQQIFGGVPLQGAVYLAHTRNGFVESMNGTYYSNFDFPTVPSLSESQALQAALDYVGADVYRWEDPKQEAWLKVEQHDPNATFYPHAHLVYAPVDWVFDAENYRLCYRFNIYAETPLYRADVFVDAISGEVISENQQIHHADVTGSAQTAYSGTQSIVTDSNGGSFRLREAGRGNGIETYDMNTGTNYGNAVDFTDADNNWNNVNVDMDEVATDAHWGCEMTYDYFFLEHGRNSLDDAGFALISYVHYDNLYANAFWDGQRMTYGDGNGTTWNPLTALDICGHEVAHGLTTNTANLVYQDEPGALNESFSDIFGTAIEWYAKPGTANWLMGEDIGSALRSLSDPGVYGDPDTYNAGDWYTGTADNGGVHTNSGVQNYWFYLLSVGGSGTNDAGDVYTVNSIGIDDAAAIAFRNLTVYLGVNSTYADARFYAIQSAIDLFGNCSPQVIECTNAWYAVNVGEIWDPTVIADFTADLTSNCDAPFMVNFTNVSSTSGTVNWDFGDGNTSTSNDPSHTYATQGLFTVTLILDAGLCGIDTIVYPDYINIDPANPCVAVMPPTGGGTTQTSCIGTLWDSGGPAANYGDQMDVTMTIAPTGATSVTLNFNTFGFEASFDYLYIYDGPTVGSPLIGQYDGTALPNGGSVTSTGGSITLRQESDPGVNELGFELDWQCFIPNSPPIVDFDVDNQNSCSGIIQFTDQTLFNPSAWSWDFGDGNTSTSQNPLHTYANDGTYTITLTATNTNGVDSIIRVNYVVVAAPAGPGVTDDVICAPGIANLAANGGSGDLNWYDAPTGGNLLNTGSTYAPNLTATTNYWVEEVFGANPVQVGPIDNSFGGGGYFTGDQHQIFDVYTDIVLETVDVDANGGGNRTIELRDAQGNVLQSLTTNIGGGVQTVTLNWSIPPGTNYQLGTGANPDLYRNNDSPTYPYTAAGLASITSSSAGAQYYYFFYNWQITEPYCISSRTQVIGAVVADPTIADDSRCGAGVVNLGATGTGLGTLTWYDAPTGGNVVNTGGAYGPNLSNTTIYYVEEEITPSPGYVGPADNSFGTGAHFTGTQYLTFDVASACDLVSVWVDANGGGNRTIELQDNTGTVLQTTTVNIPGGQSRVTLNFPLTPGVDYRLFADQPDLYRNNVGVNFPYDLAGVVTITNSSAGTGFYYHFYDWEIQEAACASNRIPVTGTISPQADATITPAGPFCPNDPALTLSAATGGGTWSGSGITNGSTGDFDPAIAGQGSHVITYSITGICGDLQTITIFISSAFNATITPPSGTVCSNGGTITLAAASGGGLWSGTGITDSNAGTFDPGLAGAGTYTITYTIAGSCGDVDTETVTVTAGEDATITTASTSYCVGDAAFNVAALNAGGTWTGSGITDANLGTWDPATAGIGTHTITYSIAGTCADAQTVDLTVTGGLDATITPTGPYCTGDQTVTLAAADGGGSWSGTGITDVNAGTFDPASAGVGTFTITYTIPGSCGDTQTTTITVTASGDATITAAGPYCEGDPSANLAAVDGGGTWSGTGITDANAGTFDPASAGVGTHVVTYAITGTCGDIATTQVEVLAQADATIAPVGPICDVDPTFNFTGTTSGGTWSGSGIVDSNTGAFDPAVAGPGSHTITYTIADPCGDQQMLDVNVEICDGIGELDNAVSMNIYPNPNNGVFTIELVGAGLGDGAQLEVVNMLGEVVYSDALKASSGVVKETLNVDTHARGVYFVRVQGEGFAQTKRIIIH
jgi:Zn-dependent metalloprotease